MAVHDLLRELVETRGPGVVGDADQFRGALDDYLDEHEASRGEINLLVDAVRLGAVTRVVAMLDHGAEPGAALDEVALALARDRGADSATGARWALGVITFALGKVDASSLTSDRPSGIPVPQVPPAPPMSPGAAPDRADLLRATQPEPPRESTPAPAPAPTPASTPTPAPAPPPAPARPPAPPTNVAGDQPPRPGTAALPDLATEPLPPYGRPPEPSSVDVAPARSRRGRALAVAAAVLLLVGGGAVAAVVLTDDDPAGGPSDSGSEGDPGGDSADPPSGGVPGGVLAPAELAVAVGEDEENSLYLVDTADGSAEQLTAGPDDRSPTVSPDRSMIAFLRGTESSGPKRLEPYLLDLGTGEVRPLFDESSPCDHSVRPAWSPGGDRLVVHCTDDVGDSAGVFIVGLDGQEIQQLTLDGSLRGAPTWYSETELLYSRYVGSEGGPSSIWYFDIDGGIGAAVSTAGTVSDLHPDWSEEQGGVLFQRSATQGETFGELWYFSQSLDGGGEGEKQLDVGMLVTQPTWSADGTQMAFVVETDDGLRLASAPYADPADVTVYDDVPGEPRAPAWGSR